MSWGGLNPALTSWRNGILARFPNRGSQSDGARADKNHASSSQHQEDADGTVDAYDGDVNYLGSSVPSGTPAERRILEALKKDFEADPRAQLWISNREIANADIDDWRERDYHGDSPHTEHTHWQSRQSRERDGRPWPMPHTDALLREMEDDMTDEDRAKLALLPTVLEAVRQTAASVLAARKEITKLQADVDELKARPA